MGISVGLCLVAKEMKENECVCVCVCVCVMCIRSSLEGYKDIAFGNLLFLSFSFCFCKSVINFCLQLTAFQGKVNDFGFKYPGLNFTLKFTDRQRFYNPIHYLSFIIKYSVLLSQCWYFQSSPGTISLKISNYVTTDFIS